MGLVHAQLVVRDGDTQGSRDGVGGMARHEGVVLALVRIRETTDTAELTVGGEAGSPSREDLMSVSLMAHVPDDLILRHVIHIMQCDGQLHDAEARSQVSRIMRELVDDETTQFVANLR